MEIVFSLACSPLPVSYTHLDVYKRQATIDGGNLHNAIPREAKAVITIPANRKEDLAIWANEMDEMCIRDRTKVC